MSISAINWIMGDARTPSLTGPKNGARLVLLSLANHTNDTDESWPKTSTICRESALSKAAANKSLRWLIEHGYIVVTEAPPGIRATAYRLVRDIETGSNRATGPAHIEPLDVTKPAHIEPRPAHIEPRPAHIEPRQQFIPLSVEPSLNPQGNPHSSTASVEDLFARFWQRYPRKVGKTGKGGAHGAFLAAMKRDGLEPISAGLKAWRSYWTDARTAESLIPYPATWLNQSRYLDPPGKPAATNDRDRRRDERDALRFDDDGNVILDDSSLLGRQLRELDERP